MNYNSWIFWLLFSVVYVCYWKLSHKQQNTLLLIASYVFYGFWDYRFLFLVLISTIIDFIGGLGVKGLQLSQARLRDLGVLLVGSSVLLCSHIRYDLFWSGLLHADINQLKSALPTHLFDFAVPFKTLFVTLAYGCALPWLYALPSERRRKYFLSISMVANLAILGFFKYCNFFLANVAGIFSAMGLGHFAVPALDIILPAGISFYTFQAMSYTIDIYRNKLEPISDFRDFALFVCFFPHLVAGPIMRAHTLLPQVVHPRRLKHGDLEEGLLLVLIGLFKKLVIADNMAPMANSVFFRFSHGMAGNITGPETLIAVYAFAFQIYADFSGYSNIARGISKWLGFELMVNFRMPYLAVSPSDFWQRWHISLSSWLRDYLYIPLGGNRGSRLATYRNLMLTMLLGGLWHGASWTFVAWGLYHGVVLCLFRLLNIRDSKPGRNILQCVQWLGQVLVMFQLTCLGWLIFRADRISAVLQMLTRIATNYRFNGAAGLILLIFYCAPLFAFEWALDGENQLQKAVQAPWLAKSLIFAYLLFMLLIFHASNTYEFIYFQF